MIKFIKRFFCKHSWDYREALSFKCQPTSYMHCLSCDKKRKITFDDYGRWQHEIVYEWLTMKKEWSKISNTGGRVFYGKSEGLVLTFKNHIPS